jgi:hypothetical protein
MMTDVAPNLKRLLDYQKEDLEQYFIGTDAQLATLSRRLEQYTRNYRNYVAHYERTAGDEVD